MANQEAILSARYCLHFGIRNRLFALAQRYRACRARRFIDVRMRSLQSYAEVEIDMSLQKYRRLFVLRVCGSYHFNYEMEAALQAHYVAQGWSIQITAQRVMMAKVRAS